MMNKFSGSICFASLSIKSLVFSFLEATSLTAETFYLKKGKSPLSTTRLQDKSCVSTLSLLLSCPSFNQLQGWSPRLVACGSHRLVPASHPPCLRPTPPPTSYTSSKNRTGHQAFYWPIKLETGSDWSGRGERRLAGEEGERGAAGREL